MENNTNTLNRTPILKQKNNIRSSGITLNQVIKDKIILASKTDSNVRDTFSPSKFRNSAIMNNSKTIYHLEIKPDIELNNTVEYYLNILLKHKKMNYSSILNNKNDSAFTTNINNKSSNFNNNLSVNGNKKEIFDSLSTQEDLPFNYLEHNISSFEDENLMKIIKSQYSFENQPQEILNLIASEIIYLTIPKNKTIYDQNDDGNFFYIIQKGSVTLKKNNQTDFKKTLSRSDTFGELSLFSNKKREETVTCNENISLYLLDGESFREVLKKNNEAILNERFNFLNNVNIFQFLDKISKYNVAQKMKLRDFHSNHKIINFGEIGDKMYMIKRGIVSCRIGFKEIRKLGNNDYFGQNSILIDVKRGADIITLQRCQCYELSRDDLKEALSSNYINVILYCFFMHCISQNEYLRNIFSEKLMKEIFQCFVIKTYSKNEYIYNPNNEDDFKSNEKRLIIIIEGSVFKGEKWLGDKFFIIGYEIFKNYSKTIQENIFAYPDCITLEAKIDDIAKIMNIDLSKEKPLNILRSLNKLRKLYLFKNLSETTLYSIAQNMKKRKYAPGEIIVQEGTYGDTFFLISKGKVEISSNSQMIRVLESGDSFGEKVLLTNDSFRTATATAKDNVVCYIIAKNEFDIILTDKGTRDYLLNKLILQDTNIPLQDLNYIKFLGKGKFGSVSLVHNHKNIYAIKAISRKSVEREKMLAKYFVNERNIMLSLDHPFIVKMVKSMKNAKFCFLLIEYVNGMNLDERISNRPNKKNIYELQFYIGSMLLMLDYLHKRQIAHRDLKPANIMINSDGYLKMIDFGTAKIIKNYTTTIIGTPHYIAPEILRGKGYSLSCDFWSLGICMYEIFYGIYPFGNYANEVIEIYKDVLTKNFICPNENSKTVSVNCLIRDLLNKKVNERECNVNNLMNKPFFEGFDFEELIDFKLAPPYKPRKTINVSQYLKESCPYENMLKDDDGHHSKKKKHRDEYPQDYDPNWADVF